MKKLLIVEDDASISELIYEKLKDEPFEISHESNGLEAYKLALKGSFDVIILDVMLPDKQGTDICRDLRANGIEAIIIMLTSKSEEIDKILGLEFGADDYITKPFSPRELLSRIKARIRRVDHQVSNANGNGSENKSFVYGDLKIDTDKRKVVKGDKVLDLTPKEFDLLHLLCSNPGKIYSRSQLLSLVWGTNFEGFEHTVNTHINRLRTKIENDPTDPQYVLTTWGVGYKFRDDN